MTFSINISGISGFFKILIKGSKAPSASIIWQTPLLHQVKQDHININYLQETNHGRKEKDQKKGLEYMCKIRIEYECVLHNEVSNLQTQKKRTHVNVKQVFIVHICQNSRRQNRINFWSFNGFTVHTRNSHGVSYYNHVYSYQQ